MATISSLTYTVHDDVPAAEGQVVDDGLGSYNESAAPLHEVRPLSCFARGPAGEVIGGAVGRTWGACCELQQLWVEEPSRGRGIGSRLVREFEQRAAARGCSTVYLETFSFQAPARYRSLGYEFKVELHGFAPGVVKYVMVRETAA
jgi:GNAT superfamily N-acetyltransferase